MPESTQRLYISCKKAEAMRDGLIPVESFTNYIDGQVVQPRLPPVTSTVWADPTTAQPVLHDNLSKDGCRHWIAM